MIQALLFLASHLALLVFVSFLVVYGFFLLTQTKSSLNCGKNGLHTASPKANSTKRVKFAPKIELIKSRQEIEGGEFVEKI